MQSKPCASGRDRRGTPLQAHSWTGVQFYRRVHTIGGAPSGKPHRGPIILLMGLRSIIRAVARRWKLALILFLGTLAIGLAVWPGAPFTYTAVARVTEGEGGTIMRTSVFERAVREELGAEFSSATPVELERSVARLRAATSVKAGHGATSVSCRDTRPALAVAMANAVAGAYASVAAEKRRKGIAGALEAVERRLREMAPAGSTAHAADAPPEDPALRLARARLAELEQARAASALEIADLTARIDALSRRVERGDAGPAKALDTSESDRLTTELEAAIRHLESLRLAYPDDWPPVARALAQADELRTRRDRAVSREVLAARFAPLRELIEELRALSARRDRLQVEEAPRAARIAELQKLPKAPLSSVPILAGDPESRRRLEARRAELLMERDGLSSPRVEPAPAASMTGFALPILIATGLLLGLGGACAAEGLATTIRTEHDVRRYVNLPLLGIVPFESRAEDRVLLSGDPRAPLAEVFNSAGALLETHARKESIRMFAVTSLSPGEGKSTVACNLALALARGGTRVLLLDADLRRAAQHQIFSLWNQAGLSSYLTGSTDEIDGLIATTSVESLHLLLAGPLLENPVPYLRSERFRALLPDLRGRYDLVLVDLPPIGSAADALLAAPLMDGILLVLSAPETRKDQAAEAKRLLRAAGGKLAGCVLNKATVRSRGYYCYSPAPVAAAD